MKIHAELTQTCGPRVAQLQSFGKDSGRFQKSNYSQRYKLCRSLNTDYTNAIFFCRVVERGDELRYLIPRTLTQLEKDQEEGHTHTHTHTHTHHTHTHSPRHTLTFPLVTRANIYIVAFILTAPHTLFKLTIYQPNGDKHSVI